MTDESKNIKKQEKKEQRKRTKEINRQQRLSLNALYGNTSVLDLSASTGRGFGYYTLLFSLVFAIIGLFVWGVNFLAMGKSLVESGDGVLQHSMSLAYYGQYLRDIFINLFKNHKLVLPMFEFSLGYGSDIIQTLNYYCIGEPLNVLSIFVPQAATEILYSILIIVRFYLSGLFFSLFMWDKTKDKFGILLGALSYSFCGFALQLGMRHPFFLTGMIYLPIVLLCIDKILQGEWFSKHFTYEQLFILTIFLSAVSNFYTFYMNCCLMIIYAAVRYFRACNPFKFKHLLGTLGKFALFTVIGVCLAAPILFPQILNMVQNNRTSTDVYVGVFHSLSYYFNLIKSVTDVNSVVTDVILGFSSVSLFGLAAVLSKKDKNLRDVKILSIVALIFLIFPFFAHVLNGMSYVSNRWAYAIALIPSYAIAKIYPELTTLTKKETGKTAIILAVYALVGVVFTKTLSASNMFVVAMIFICLVCVLLVKLDYIKVNTFKHILVWNLAICICFNSIAVFGINRGNFAANFYDIGTVYDYQRNADSGAVTNSLEDKSFYRVADYARTGSNNSTLINDYNATKFYLSTTNPVVADFIDEMELATPYQHLYYNMQNRSILEKVSGVKYAVMMSGSKLNGYTKTLGQTTINKRAFLDSTLKNIVYGFNNDSVNEKSDADVMVHTTNSYLPMGYTYDSYIAREDYEKLTAIQKQNSLLQGAVVEKAENVKKIQPDNSDVMLADLTVESIKNAEIVDANTIKTTSSNAIVTFKVKHNSSSEAYVTLEGLKWKPTTSFENIDETLEEFKTEYDADVNTFSKVKMFFGKKYETLPDQTNITANMNGSTTSLTYFSEKNIRYAGKHDFSMCLTGRAKSENEYDTLTLRFQQIGEYSFDKLFVQYQSLQYVDGRIGNLTRETLTNVNVDANTVTGRISLSSPKILCTQIPYASSWTAYVDGEKQEILKCNTMFCGLELGKGEHTIEFCYQTPLMNISFPAFIIALAAFVTTGFIIKSNERYEDRKKNKETTSSK